MSESVIAQILGRRIERDLLQIFTGNTNTAAAASDSVLTVEKLKAAMGELRGLAPPLSLKIVLTPCALKETTERLFPESKNRSKRIRKKLIKRPGGEFRRRPAMWRFGDMIYAHPAFRSQLEAQFKETNRVQMQSAYENPILRQTWL